MKQTKSKVAPSFMAKNKDLLVVGGAIIVLAGAATAYYFFTKKKEKKQLANAGGTATAASTSSGASTTYQSPPFVPVNTGSSSSGTKPIITKRGYPIKIGSRHADVKVLQRYLKIYKEDLGRSGPKRDGVDGIFGPKTSRAAQKRLKKTVFTQADIAGMRKALVSLGK
ncbi:peptidoglycan-binding protein [Lacinutrix sp. WUR7]|uniref:peptidoglycan-binding domain-containing protein n=1 Tax=Lacinutrix sp. WUR7 TaxID=2653681 RepID=UPI00193D94CD|nr:peptidoglycan-binding domain-containing protein [Lacinutrix sp. WUR7]QRM89520.1 peptidoglycan-binding protein [Lacinutrix sp. WUR7]